MATKLFFGALATLSSTLVLGSTLTLITAPASAFEVERGHHGASRIVTDKQAQPASQPTQQQSKTQTSQTQASPRSTPIFVRGPHGAYRIVTQEGVGGPVRDNLPSQPKGFPELDGTVHAQDGWF